MEVQDEIVVPDEVNAWERDHRLPELIGTPRQTAWARLVRHRFLTPVFGEIIEATAPLSPTTAASVYEFLDEIRADRNAREWIELYRHHVGNAATAVIRLAASRAAQRAKEERQRAEEERQRQEAAERDQQAAKTRSLTKEARIWEAAHGLPEIVGLSQKQVNFGRRARYQLCKAVPEEARHRTTEAAYWIDWLLRKEDHELDRQFVLALGRDGPD